MREAERQLQRIGMAELMHEQAGNLALGPQRLMEIARALCADPTLLLLDEPAAGLRLKEKEGLAGVLRQLRDEGLSILLVEHDMHVIYNALAATKGAGGGDALLAAMKGQIFESPRGSILIDAQTRDIVQDIYIRKVERQNGQLYNVEFDVQKAVKDPGKTK